LATHDVLNDLQLISSILLNNTENCYEYEQKFLIELQKHI